MICEKCNKKFIVSDTNSVCYFCYPKSRRVVKSHITSSKCWCRPKKVYKDKKNGSEVWVHFKKRSKRKGK